MIASIRMVKVIPSFKTNRDRTRNTITDDIDDLNNFWKRNEVEESMSEIPDENESHDTHRKEADIMVNKYFDNIESIVNKQKPNKIEDDDDNDFDDNNWA